jgi:DNA polymerase V
MPVSIGIGPSKTLAKAANFFAKRQAMLEGVKIFSDPAQTISSLLHVPVRDVWGVGAKSGAKLNELGIMTAQDLAKADPLFLKKKFNVMLARTAYELKGISCLPLGEEVPRQNIMVSRSFAYKKTAFSDLREAVTSFAANAAEKLRQQHSVACGLMVFIRTSPFNKNDAQYANSICLQFIKETDNTVLILKTATQGLKTIYREGYQYKKAGVILLDLVPNDIGQKDFFIDDEKINNKALMGVVDTINDKYGRRMIQFASCGIGKIWAMRQENRTKAYTTNWDELLIVQAN